jgi:two-component system, chemotaxis family, protein-glutamate methylesterase/glutaminase
MDTANVLIVDDSRIFRAAIESALSGLEGIAVVGSVFRGELALDFIRNQPPDMITLDVEMPGMNGLQTLQAIQQFNRTRPAGCEVGVIMVSAFTQRGADVTMQALDAGAFDFVTKPTGGTAEENVNRLRQDLLPKIKQFLARRRRSAQPGTPSSVVLPAASTTRAVAPVDAAGRRATRAILIGASTGGPKALAALLPGLIARIDAPVLVVQHMPPGFTQSLAQHLARQLQTPVLEAEEGQAVERRTIYIAPGGKHLVLRGDRQNGMRMGVNEQPPESGCRPSASVLFRSAASILGREAVAIVLTGMGNDGTSGLGAFKRAGGYVIAQDEDSSVVWGMPGSAVAAGVVDVVVPLCEIPAAVEAVTNRKNGV